VVVIVKTVQSRFAETPTLTLTLNPNFGKSGFGESGRHRQDILVHLLLTKRCSTRVIDVAIRELLLTEYANVIVGYIIGVNYNV